MTPASLWAGEAASEEWILAVFDDVRTLARRHADGAADRRRDASRGARRFSIQGSGRAAAGVAPSIADERRGPRHRRRSASGFRGAIAPRATAGVDSGVRDARRAPGDDQDGQGIGRDGQRSRSRGQDPRRFARRVSALRQGGRRGRRREKGQIGEKGGRGRRHAEVLKKGGRGRPLAEVLGLRRASRRC